MSDGFSTGVEQWRAKLGLVRDAVRQELVARQLAEHLPTAEPPLRVLDVGCGQGTQALRIAADGHRVTGIDPSGELLDIARTALERQPVEVRARVDFVPGTLGEARDRVGQDFDVVCCHGVLMYLPELQAPIGSLVQLTRSGGLVSVLTRNRASIAMRAGMLKDWPGALNGFDAHRYINRLGLEGVRADEPEEVIAALEREGAELVAWYGVRLFTDHWVDEQCGADLDQLLEAEEQAGRREPYRRLTSLTHVIATRVHS